MNETKITSHILFNQWINSFSLPIKHLFIVHQIKTFDTGQIRIVLTDFLNIYQLKKT